MIFHPEEYKAAQDYWKGRQFLGVSPEQYNRIKEKGQEFIKFQLRHPGVHHLISFLVFVVIFWLDWWVLLKLGNHIASSVWAGIVIGISHSFIIYSLAVYTLHEGAAHKLIVLRKGRISRFFSIIANNISRITFAETDYYAKNHLSHHAHFTTSQDDEFLNFVFAKRFYRVFFPFASIFNFSDFKAHSGMNYSSSRVLSLVLTFLYNLVFALLMLKHYSWLTVFIALVLIFPNLAFWLDRMRQYMEHNIMPLNSIDGARDLGLDFWGLIIGGGPWGQPCHWTHHLYPGIPWYNQLRLHMFIKKTLNPEQRKVFFLTPLIGYPLSFLRVIKATSKY